MIEGKNTVGEEERIKLTDQNEEQLSGDGAETKQTVMYSV